MSAPDLESFAANLYYGVGPLAGEEASTDYALAKFSGALGTMFQPVEDLARDTPAGPGWSSVMDLARCPSDWLSWLAQFVGTTVPAGADDATARAWIASTDGFRRGTPAAIRGAAESTLTGSQTVYLRERDGDPYRLEVVVMESDVSEVERAVTNVTTNPRPASATGWNKQSDQLAVTLAFVNDATSPTGRALKITGNATANAQRSYVLAPIANVGFAVGTRIAYGAAVKYVSGPVNVSSGYAYQAGATIITLGSGAGMGQPAAWVRRDDNEAIPKFADYGAAVDRLAPLCAIQSTGVGAFEVRVAAAFAERVYGNTEIPAYGDPATTPGKWTWQGAADASSSDRLPATTTQDAVVAQKPGGIILSFRVSRGQDYQEVTAVDGKYSNVAIKYPKYSAMVVGNA